MYVSVLTVLAILVLICGLGLLIPALTPTQIPGRMACSNNLKQIGIALHNYHAVYRSLPPAYTVDEYGNRLHSWRTLILPFIEQQAIYETIDLSKPWNDPANLAAFETAISTYACPSDANTPDDPRETTYLAVINPSGAMPGSTPTSFREITDGLATTLVIVEIPGKDAVHWMSPHDVESEVFINGKRPTIHSHGFLSPFLKKSMRKIMQKTELGMSKNYRKILIPFTLF